MAAFLWLGLQFWIPGRGFTYLLRLGDRGAAERYLPELRAMPHYAEDNSGGYDGQFGVQLALRPRPGDPDVAAAMDNLPYRARRILFSWTAWLAGGGDPARVANVYAAQNLIGWLVLAVLLWRWLPPTGWGNTVRWGAILAAYGMCVSLRGSLVDGPSLCLVAGGVALAESGRRWWAAAVLGLAGLGRETNVLGGAALVRKEWRTSLGPVALTVLPLVCWWAWVGVRFGAAGDSAGSGNLALPFAGYIAKWREVLGELLSGGRDLGAKWECLVLVSLSTQMAVLALRPRWGELWWRVGVAYLGLAVLLGSAVWVGYPAAVSRVLLPMTLAFNVLLPRGRRWWAVLVLGNLSVLGSYRWLEPPVHRIHTVSGVHAGRGIEVTFDEHWFEAERSLLERWRWSKGDAAVTLRNPQSYAVEATLTFDLRTNDTREIRVRDSAGERWRGVLEPKKSRTVRLERVRLAPGDNLWRFENSAPATTANAKEIRALGFSLRELQIEILGPAEK